MAEIVGDCSDKAFEKRYVHQQELKRNAPEMDRIKREIEFCISMINCYSSVRESGRVEMEVERMATLRKKYIELEDMYNENI